MRGGIRFRVFYPLVTQVHIYARVVELADSLDSGSSVLYGRAGSSPASRTKKERQALPVSLFWYSVLCLQQRAALCRRVRPCLINDRMRREIFLLGKANIRRNTLCISKIFSAAQRKNIRCLDALTCFKQGLIEPLRGRAAEGFPLVPYTRVIGESLFMIKGDSPFSD